jgi:MFS family permease
MLASQIIAVAVGWQIYDLTHSALNLGLIGLTQFIPLLLLVLVVGLVADRYDRRAISIASQLAQGAAAMVLVASNLAGFVTPVWIYAAVLLVGFGRAFEGPTMQALMPNLVPSHLIAAAAARWSSASQTAVIIGPAVGGVLYAVRPSVAYGIAAGLYIFGSLLVSLIRIEARVVQGGPATAATLFAGIAFIRRQPVVLGAITLDLFAVLLGGASALLPIYARDILVMGPWGLGLLRSAPAVGALAMSLVIGRVGLRRKTGLIMFAGVAIYGVATIVFGLSRSFELSFAAFVLLGMVDVISVVIRQSLVAILTPDAMRGRVSAVNQMFIGTSNMLGEFRAGVSAAAFGPVAAVLIGGVAAIVVAAVGMRVFPELAAIDSPESAVT